MYLYDFDTSSLKVITCVFSYSQNTETREKTTHIQLQNPWVTPAIHSRTKKKLLCYWPALSLPLKTLKRECRQHTYLRKPSVTAAIHSRTENILLRYWPALSLPLKTMKRECRQHPYLWKPWVTAAIHSRTEKFKRVANRELRKTFVQTGMSVEGSQTPRHTKVERWTVGRIRWVEGWNDKSLG